MIATYVRGNNGREPAGNLPFVPACLSYQGLIVLQCNGPAYAALPTCRMSESGHQETNSTPILAVRTWLYSRRKTTKDAMRPEQAAASSFDWFNRDQKGRDAMTTSPTTAPGEQTLYAALELSKNSWLSAIQFPGRDNPSLHPIRDGDAGGLMAKLDTARDRLAKLSGQVPKVNLCYEAGYDGSLG